MVAVVVVIAIMCLVAPPSIAIASVDIASGSLLCRVLSCSYCPPPHRPSNNPIDVIRIRPPSPSLVNVMLMPLLRGHC